MNNTLSRLSLFATALLGCAALLPGQGLSADEPQGPPKLTPRTADGKPDFTGYWKGSRATKPGGNLGKDLPNFELPFTEAGRAALQYNLTKTVDPESLCNLGGIPRHNASALPFMVLQTKQTTAFLYFYTYYRLIRTGGSHPEDPDPSYFGDAVGKWEGDTYVIDSVSFKGTQVWADENANPHSDDLHVIERWTRPDYDHLNVEMVVDDKKFYTKPFRYTRTFLAGEPGQTLKEYACAENPVHSKHLGFGPGPIRPDGTRGYLNAAPLPPPPTAADFADTPPVKKKVAKAK
ncbi:hypothetical protein [Bryobacter aggregatus]|uniref:hypothetical protein n=1 Tax=Bryobacter aggregatus TaxID=360054 RepID=UPI00068E1789|nr:hypothetical protein [Bryobacter aggregatus]